MLYRISAKLDDNTKLGGNIDAASYSAAVEQAELTAKNAGRSITGGIVIKPLAAASNLKIAKPRTPRAASAAATPSAAAPAPAPESANRSSQHRTRR